MKVLVINCGSSSLKYQLIDTDTEDVLAKGICERIGIAESMITHSPANGEKVTEQIDMPNHTVAFQLVTERLLDPEVGVIKSLEEIDGIGHRIVNGGPDMMDSTVLTSEVIKEFSGQMEWAPLHNPAHLIGIHSCLEVMPNTPMVGVFDTSFHKTMPAKAYMYAIPYSYYENYHIRRYGAHGTSHDFVSYRMAEMLGKKREDMKIIVCHLGNGASISAVKNGECIDTSMGLTPLEGLIMGTRSGDVDPALLQFVAKKENKTLDEVITILNKDSGVWGISGISSDFRDIVNATNEGNERAKLALEMFAYRVAKYIGSYIAAMNGLDAIAFTAGVGENSAPVRKLISEYLGYMGVELDLEKNKVLGEETIISTPESKVVMAIVPTNEELAIAREVVKLIG